MRRALTFDAYEEAAASTAVYPNRGQIGGLHYSLHEIHGEAGEISDKVKKVLRDNGGVFTPQHIESIKGEVGDTLWGLAALCYELGFNLEDAAQQNLNKLADRKERGVLGGSGDER